MSNQDPEYSRVNRREAEEAVRAKGPWHIIKRVLLVILINILKLLYKIL